MDRSFRPRSGRFGLMLEVVHKDFGANPFTANTTVTFAQPTAPAKFYVERAVVCTANVPLDADGTLVIRLFKRAAGGTRTQLTQDYNIEGNTAREKVALAFVTTLTDANRIVLEAGDALEWDLVSNSAAIDTQPTQLYGAVELSVLQ